MIQPPSFLIRFNWAVILIMLSATLLACGPKKTVVIDNTHGGVELGIWRQVTVIEDDGKKKINFERPVDFNISLARIFKVDASWSDRLGMPDAIIWALPNQQPQHVEFILEEGDYMFETVMLDSYGFPLQVMNPKGMVFFHVTAGKKITLGDLVLDYVRKYRVYPSQKVLTQFLRFKTHPVDPEGKLQSDPEKFWELSG